MYAYPPPCLPPLSGAGARSNMRGIFKSWILRTCAKIMRRPKPSPMRRVARSAGRGFPLCHCVTSPPRCGGDTETKALSNPVPPSLKGEGDRGKGSTIILRAYLLTSAGGYGMLCAIEQGKIFRAGRNSPPAVTVREPQGMTRRDSGTDSESLEERRLFSRGDFSRRFVQP